MPPSPAYFEDLHAGFSFDFREIKITEQMRRCHVELYGEDWPREVVEDPQALGIIPGPMLMSVLGGQWGRNNLLAIKLLKSIEIAFHASLHAGDTISCKTVVEEARPNRDPAKPYGYAFIRQEVYNQHGVLCCTRQLVFLVHRRESA